MTNFLTAEEIDLVVAPLVEKLLSTEVLNVESSDFESYLNQSPEDWVRERISEINQVSDPSKVVGQIHAFMFYNSRGGLDGLEPIDGYKVSINMPNGEEVRREFFENTTLDDINTNDSVNKLFIFIGSNNGEWTVTPVCTGVWFSEGDRLEFNKALLNW